MSSISPVTRVLPARPVGIVIWGGLAAILAAPLSEFDLSTLITVGGGFDIDHVAWLGVPAAAIAGAWVAPRMAREQAHPGVVLGAAFLTLYVGAILLLTERYGWGRSLDPPLLGLLVSLIMPIVGMPFFWPVDLIVLAMSIVATALTRLALRPPVG